MTRWRTVPHSRPYSWPWDGDLDAARLAVIVVGDDARWRSTGAGEPAIADRIAAIAAVADGLGAVVVSVSHPCSGADAVADQRLAELPASPLPSLPVSAMRIASAGIDGFYGSPLDPMLRSHRRDQLVIVGFGLEGPAHSTMRSANDRGYECLLITDACSPVEDGGLAPAISMITMSGGIFGAVASTVSFCEALADTSPEGVAP